MNIRGVIVSFLKTIFEFIVRILKFLLAKVLLPIWRFITKNAPQVQALIAVLALGLLAYNITLSIKNRNDSRKFGQQMKGYAEDIRASLAETNKGLKILPSSVESLDSAVIKVTSTVDRISINQDKFAIATKTLEQNVTLFGDKLAEVIEANKEQLKIWSDSRKALEEELHKVPELEIFSKPISYNQKDSTYSMSVWIRNKGKRAARGFSVFLSIDPKINARAYNEGVWVVEERVVEHKEWIECNHMEREKPVWPDSNLSINVAALRFKLGDSNMKQFTVYWQVGHDLATNSGKFKIDIPTN
ncbi:MAG TPA: hypothetical protein VGB16_04850 [candidate division Zixibacteria bacterium]